MKRILISLVISAFAITAPAQLERIIVETYYVSDSNDATNETGGVLTEGTVTYRIFADLEAGSKLFKIYGNKNHPLEISSTEPFFNNTDRGEIYGFEFNDSRLDENTAALDTWLTMGFATDDHFGIPKNLDNDGSLVGGENNDGGSEAISGGLLINEDPAMEIPLTQADGLITSDSLPGSENINIPPLMNMDTTIFGDSTQYIYYYTERTILSTSGGTGFSGLTEDNIVLLAQLTTAGELGFRINLGITTAAGENFHYVSDDDTLIVDTQNDLVEVFSNWLKYPFKSGCTDPYYLEFDNTAVTDDGSCQTEIILGCMDESACNFDPEANFNIIELCCYPPDDCDNRDIGVVCPDWSAMYGSTGEIHFNLFPNPASSFLNLEILEVGLTDVRYSIHDLYGNLQDSQIVEFPGQSVHEVNISSLKPGMYILRMYSEEANGTMYFIRQ